MKLYTLENPTIALLTKWPL